MFKRSYEKIVLTRYCPVLPFIPTSKYQNTVGFLMFSGGIKRQHWEVMG